MNRLRLAVIVSPFLIATLATGDQDNNEAKLLTRLAQQKVWFLGDRAVITYAPLDNAGAFSGPMTETASAKDLLMPTSGCQIDIFDLVFETCSSLTGPPGVGTWMPMGEISGSFILQCFERTDFPEASLYELKCGDDNKLHPLKERLPRNFGQFLRVLSDADGHYLVSQYYEDNSNFLAVWRWPSLTQVWREEMLDVHVLPATEYSVTRQFALVPVSSASGHKVILVTPGSMSNTVPIEDRYRQAITTDTHVYLLTLDESREDFVLREASIKQGKSLSSFHELLRFDSLAAVSNDAELYLTTRRVIVFDESTQLLSTIDLFQGKRSENCQELKNIKYIRVSPSGNFLAAIHKCGTMTLFEWHNASYQVRTEGIFSKCQ